MGIKKPIVIYLGIWTALVASFWLGLKDDAMLYSMIMDAVLIATSVIFPWAIVKRNPTRKTQVVVIVGIGVMMMLAEYLTFSLANNVEFGKTNIPEWSWLFIGMFLAFTDSEIGLTILRKDEEKKKRIIKLIGKIFVAYIIVSIAIYAGEKLNNDYIRIIAGDYQAIEIDNPDDPDSYVGGFWHLNISKEDGGYLSIYDNEAGNPGVEGQITEIDEESIVVKIDLDYYDELPSAKWKDDGEYLRLKYRQETDIIELTNNKHTIKFERDLDE